MKFTLKKVRYEWTDKKTSKTFYNYNYYLVSDEGDFVIEVAPRLRKNQDGKIQRRSVDNEVIMRQVAVEEKE